MKIIGVNIDHPGARERLDGKRSEVSLVISRGLASGKLDVIPLSEDDLVSLIASASEKLLILRKAR